MIGIFREALKLQEFCDGEGWQSCLIGGIAVQRWSQARVTRDIDITLLTGFGDEERFIAGLLAKYRSRIEGGGEFALRSRVLLLVSEEGVGIDVSLGALPFEAEAVVRATPYEFEPGVWLRTCSAEDLMVMKLFAARAIDMRDAEGIALRQGEGLDWSYVERQLTPLAEVKEDAGILKELERMRQLAVRALDNSSR